MRILHVISALAAGGAETLVRDLALEISARGHSVGLAYISSAKDQGNSSSYEREFVGRLKEHKIPTFEIGFDARRDVLLGAWRLRAILKKFKPDVLHIHLVTALTYRLAAFTGVKTVYTHHNVKFRFPRQLLRCFDVVVDHHVAISETNRRLLKDLTNRPVTRIYNGVAPARFIDKKRVFGRATTNVLSVGRLQEQKDYDTLIHVARLVTAETAGSGRTIKFRIAGDGADIGRLRRAASSVGLDGVVEFLGARIDIPELMAESDLMLMTSIYEGLPIALIEALHSGLPILTTNVGGCGEIVIDGHNGALATPKDAKGIARRLIEILGSPDTMARFSQNALVASTRFSIISCADQHIELYGGL